MKRIEITLSDERLAALDQARGNEARASFIKRAMDEKVADVELELTLGWSAVKPRPKRGKG